MQHKILMIIHVLVSLVVVMISISFERNGRNAAGESGSSSVNSR